MSSAIDNVILKLTKKLEITIARISKLETANKVRLIPKNGRDGRDGKNGVDGISPSVEAVVEAVLEQLPEPEKVDVKAITDDVINKIPKPRDGRDAPVIAVADVAAVLLPKIKKPKDGKDGKDGRDGPTLKAVVNDVLAQVEQGPQGEQGPPGPQGEPGEDGVSVTDVQLKDNDLFVFLDGERKKVGTIKVPRSLGSFIPGGGGSARKVFTNNAPVLVSENYSARSGDIVLVDTSGGPVEVALPLKGGARSVIVKKIGLDNNVLTVTSQGTIDGNDTLEMEFTNTSRTFVEFNEDWFIV